jgi:hypothetical protein
MRHADTDTDSSTDADTFSVTVGHVHRRRHARAVDPGYAGSDRSLRRFHG